MEYVLETQKLGKKYKSFLALNGVDIHIERGAIYGLIGKNGAGKTTLIRVICGLQKPTNGSYSIFGIKNSDKKILQVKQRMGAIIESPSIYGDLTARENLLLQFKLTGCPNIEEVDELLKFVSLSNTGKKKVKDFSLGMKQRLGIAMALANNPDFLILDEPINGLDPQGIIEIRELILKLNTQKRVTFLVSSHYLDELSKIATHYGFLDHGKIIEEISRENLVNKLSHKFMLTVKNQKEFVKFFEKNKIPYEIIDDTTINVFEQNNLSQFLSLLSQNKLVVDNIKEQEESLENYFINLIGGGDND